MHLCRIFVGRDGASPLSYLVGSIIGILLKAKSLLVPLNTAAFPRPGFWKHGSRAEMRYVGQTTNLVYADGFIFGPGVVLENRRQSSRMWRPLGYFLKLGFAPRKGLKILRDFAMSCRAEMHVVQSPQSRVDHPAGGAGGPW